MAYSNGQNGIAFNAPNGRHQFQTMHARLRHGLSRSCRDAQLDIQRNGLYNIYLGATSKYALGGIV